MNETFTSVEGQLTHLVCALQGEQQQREAVQELQGSQCHQDQLYC